jgi:F-type H+-transporting ATPase subunit b
MQDIFQQIGALLLGAIPTILLFIVLVLAYQFLVQGPLTATLRQRRARTEGAA